MNQQICLDGITKKKKRKKRKEKQHKNNVGGFDITLTESVSVHEMIKDVTRILFVF